jgi:hypothetical protein
MRPYPDPERSYQEAVTETLNTVGTNVLYYYEFFKENYIQPVVEHVLSVQIPSLSLWQWPRQIQSITYQSPNRETLDDDKDYINWANLIDEDDEKLSEPKTK